MANFSREELRALYEKLTVTCPGSILKGDTMPYTSLNGHMYSYLTKDNFLALKLPETEKEKFLKQYSTTLVQQYGIIQKDYVKVPDSLMQRTEELKSWFSASHDYVSTLRPKPTTKKKKTN